MKKASIFFVVLVVFTTLSVNCWAFTDIQDQQLEKEIEELAGINIINGYEDNTFRPKNNITRAEFSKIIMEAVINNDLYLGEYTFCDVTQEHWAYDYIYKAKYLGIVNGTSLDTFEPEANVTYEQAIKMIVCAIGYGEEAEELGGWPNGYVAKANQLGLLTNVSFVQTEYASRENIVRIVRKALDVPFYYLEVKETGDVQREYSETGIFYIKNGYQNLNIEDEYDGEQIFEDSNIEDGVEEFNEDSVG